MTEKGLWEKAYGRIFEIYGEKPDLRIISRFYSEKSALMKYGVAEYFYYDIARLRYEAEAAGEKMIAKNTAASCFVAFLLGAVDENPLPAHYLCPDCKAVEWRLGDCVFDMPSRTCACGARMLPCGSDIPFETYLPYAKRQMSVKKAQNYREMFDKILSHFQRSVLHSVSLCRELEAVTGACMDEIDLCDCSIRSKILSGNFSTMAGLVNVDFLKGMIAIAKPGSYKDLLKLLGLAHGTYTWRGNAEALIAKGRCTLDDIPATRDEVFMKIRDAMRECCIYEEGIATEICDRVRKGDFAENGMDAYFFWVLQMLGLEDWLSDYFCKIRYMSTKALSVLELKYSIIINWYSTYYPKEYELVNKENAEFEDKI